MTSETGNSPDHFNRVSELFDDLPYMRPAQATILRDLIVNENASDLLEIGFFHGKSSAYFAAVLEDLGRGHLVTIDLEPARKREPNIEQVLATLNLGHRVTPIYAHRSYTWELAKMIQANPRPQFDFCYFDGGHTWDCTGFGFALVDMLLRPGGWIVFDDLKWTIKEAMKSRTSAPRYWRACSADESATPAVKLVFDTLVPHLGYTDIRMIDQRRWGIARKPLSGTERPTHSNGLLQRIAGFIGGH
ncbi:MAG TPA: class I SAM-dependent methyltransferase [Woeseiaceae bacterium]|nr:class I SAM-dependent methyltransferase [Woeseiaceae bacterium]